LTVVCPVVVFCTSSDDPVMAAMVPDAPGNCRAAPLPLPLVLPVLDGAAVEEVVEAEDDEPHAVKVTTATPRADQAAARRNGDAHPVGRDPATCGLVADFAVLFMGFPCCVRRW
jgi:hypothetical protein